MAKDPVLPLYYNDITSSTQDWSDEEFGAYMRLLIHQWDKGGIPNDPVRLNRIITSLGSSWVTVGLKFSLQDGLLKNSRMEEIRAERERFKQKQRDNGKNGGRPPKINPNETQNKSQVKPKKKPLEEEVEIEEEDIVEDNKGGTGEKFEYDAVPSFLIVREFDMIWKKENPEYDSNTDMDYPHLRKIMTFLVKKYGLIEDNGDEFYYQDVLNEWRDISKYVAGHNYYFKYNLKQISDYIQSINQERKIGKPANGKNIITQAIQSNEDAKKIIRNIYNGK